MSLKEKTKDGVIDYYNSVSNDYFEQYRKENLETGKKYPQNYYRLQWIIERLATLNLKSVYEVGTGEGTPLVAINKMGYEVAGCDISKNMVDFTKQNFKKNGIIPDNVQWADIEDTLTFTNQIKNGKYDALIALGVMPHVNNDGLALRNMKSLLNPGGKVFVEFRNKMFSLFTFNKYTKEFILDDLMAEVSDDLKNQVNKELDKYLVPEKESDKNIDYSKIKAKFHNPFEVPQLMINNGFKKPKIHWYHFHPAPTFMESRDKVSYWKEAAKLEHKGTDEWKGYFMCSAMCIEAEV
jgi:2-polyprenyl-3-methyl-5-hydroxy-6-metoxy-1,4-benzoquinol methylase